MANGPPRARAVCSACASSASFDGASTRMFGTMRVNARSNMPWCVGPSSPTTPARSMANTTSKFGRALLMIIWSMARCKNVE